MRVVWLAILLLGVAAMPLWGEDDGRRPHRGWKRVWVVSGFALAAASAIDFSSSVGKYEANPALRGGGGQFSTGRGIAIKGGVAAGMLLYQHWMMRRHPMDESVVKTAAIANFAGAGVMGAVAVKNGRVE